MERRLPKGADCRPRALKEEREEVDLRSRGETQGSSGAVTLIFLFMEEAML